MSQIIRTDVTAVKLHENFVFVGIGSTINIYDKTSLKLIQKLHALLGQKIYSFVPTTDKVLVFGGKQFTVLTKKYNDNGDERDSNRERKFEEYVRTFEPIVCDDWLHSGVWINEDVVALLTAHNVVQKWDIKTQTLWSQHPSKDNSILYSGSLLKLDDDVLVLAGTVFSEVIVHRCGLDKPLHHLKGHKGVIFSISCDQSKHLIVTTSDDRSVRIWGPNTIPSHPTSSQAYWENLTIVCKHDVYGHLARVMRSCIINDIIVSVGEDSAICYWDFNGKLLKKATTHQNGSIWAVDADNNHLVTGGGDCGVSIHPLTIATEYSTSKVINIDVDTPKKVAFTSRRNLIIMDDYNLIYYNSKVKSKAVFNLNHESTYKLLSISNCKQLIAVSDMKGKLDVFLEACKDEAFITNIIDTKLELGKILSMQWAGNRHLVFCSDNGIITVLASNNLNAENYAEFILPPCKERWLTASAVDSTNNTFVLGDRCGNIHVFVKGKKEPIKTFSKVHGRYGPTSIKYNNSEIITTGRDGTVRYFITNHNTLKYMTSKDIPFVWVEKFLDKDDNIICGFQERDFIVYNIKDSNKMIEVPCGGGHRSWDAVRYIQKINKDYEEFIDLIYLKNSDINVIQFQLSKIVSRNIINGSHSKEINCLKTQKVDDFTLYISGGEDTTLRISSVHAAMNFQDEVSFKHLSSIRTLKMYPLVENNNFLLVSAGGRAQICIKDVKFSKQDDTIKVASEELIDFQIKGTDKERKGNQTWRNRSVDFDPEMRIMDLDLIRDKDTFIICAGCSDAYLRVFKYNDKRLEFVKDTKYHSTCILKTKCIKVFNKDIIITCTTRGDVTFWDANDIRNNDFNPFFSTKTNKSGINSLECTIISDNRIVIATGGDDNAIHMVLLEIKDQHNKVSMKVLHTWNCSNYHSSEITGLVMVDNYLLSTSIDQRISLLRWRIEEEEIVCEMVKQLFSDVADIQGMDLLEYNG